MPAKTKGPSQEAVDRLVTSYLINEVKQHADADHELFDALMELHDSAVMKGAPEDPGRRLEQVRDNPLVQGAVAVMGQRVQRLLDTGVRIAQDTQAIRTNLKERLREDGVDPEDPRQRAAAVAEYERVLAETIPLDVAIDNVEALAEVVDLANDVLNPGSAPKQMVYEMAWKAFKKTLFQDPDVIERMDRIKADLQGDRKRLTRIAALVREVGPTVVREAYQRGAAAGPRVSEAPGRRAAAPRKSAGGRKAVTAGKGSGSRARGKSS